MNKLNILKKNSIKAKLKNKINEDIILKVYTKVSSTNSKAKEFVKESEQLNKKLKDEFFVFAADKQFNGRGRRGHEWESGDPASIYVSFLFRVPGKLENTPQVTAAAALAVNKTLQNFDLENTIKWPNDIMIADKKISGILSELFFLKKNDGEKKEAFVIIGCGLNLNNYKFNSNLKNTATSYYLEKAIQIDKNLFLAVLVNNIYFYIKKYFSSARKELLEDWKKKLNLKGKKIDLVFKNKSYTAIIKEILNSGEILVSFDDGREKILQSVNTSLDYQSLKKYNY